MGDRATSSGGGESLRNYFRRSLHKMSPDSDSMFCQNPKCTQGDAVAAVKVCHNCASRPLLLCIACDKRAHSDLRSRGHMRFDLPGSSRPLSSAAATQGSSSSAALTATATGTGAGSQTLSPSSSTSGSGQQLVPLHSRSVSLPDRRTTSSTMLSFYEPAGQQSSQQLPHTPAVHAAATVSLTGSGCLAATAGHFRFPSTDEGSEEAAAADGSEHSDLDVGSGEPFDEIDGRYRRTTGGRYVYQVDTDCKSCLAPGEATYRPLPPEGGTKWIRVTSEMLEQSASKSWSTFTVYLYLTDGEPLMHIVPVEKGVKIRQALDRLLAEHHLTFDDVDVFVGSNFQAPSLSGVGETSFVGGMVLRVFLQGQSWKELARRASNGSLPSSSGGATDRSLPVSRVEDMRGSSSLDPAFRKGSSTTNRLRTSTSASGGLSVASGGLSATSALHGRSSYANFKRGTQRDSKKLESAGSGISQRLLQLSENSGGSSSANHQSDDGASEIGGSSSGRQVRKVASTSGFTLYAGSASDDAHHDVSPSGTISKRGGAAAAVAQALTGRSSLLPAFSTKEKDKFERLALKLEEWSLNGIPEMVDLSMSHLKLEPRLIDLEEHWTRFISPEGMPSKQKDQQEALWELFTTEVEYMKSLRNVVIELFMSCLFNLQSDQLLNEVASDKLFGNVETVVDINISWWQSSLLPVLEHSRRTNEPLNARLLKSAFSGFGQRFAPYAQYCLEQPICSKYLKSIDTENELFSIFVKWAQAQKQCNRLKLHDLLVKPMQRLTRYTLLLNAILKKTEDPDAKRDLGEMISTVHAFVKDVDLTLHEQERSAKLSELAQRFDSYDAVDMPYNDAESNRLLMVYSGFDVRQPMPGCGKQLRHMLHDGPLKMKEGSLKSDVHCFVFTDIFLITKVKRADRYKIIKAPIRVDQCVVEELGKDGNAYFLLIQLTDYGVIQAAYAFHGANLEKWVKAFKTAKEVYEVAKQNAVRPRGVPVSPALLDGQDDMGFVGPDLPRVDSDGFNAAAEDTVGGASSSVATLSASLAAGGIDSDDGGSCGATSEDRSGSGYGGEEYELGDGEAAAAYATAYSGSGYTYGSRSVGSTSAAVTRSASSPVMSSRLKAGVVPGSANMRQQDAADDRAGIRRGRRYLTADTIQPFAHSEQGAQGYPPHAGPSSTTDNRSGANGQDYYWEQYADAVPQSNASREASAGAAVGHGHSGGDGVVRTSAVAPRAMPRRHVPAVHANHRVSSNGMAQSDEAGAVGGASGNGTCAGAASYGSGIDDRSSGTEWSAVGSSGCDGTVQHSAGRVDSVQYQGSRSSRKLSQAELMRMREQMFTASPHDGAEV